MSGPDIFSIERPYNKEGAPSCGIYMIAPEHMSPQLFLVQLKQAFAALHTSPYQRHMHALEIPASTPHDVAAPLVDLCKRNGIVPIIRGNIAMCGELGAEGVLLDDVAHVAAARAALPESAIVGLACGNSQTHAQAALDAKIDYVTLGHFFGEDADAADIALLSWWNTQTHLPAAAIANLNPARAVHLAQEGAGFIGAGDWLWNHEEGPEQGIYWLQKAIEQGLSNRVTH